MKQRNYKYYAADFETTVYNGQEFTEVWASALVPFHTEDVIVFTSIRDTWKWAVAQTENICLYYHNLKFDGSFWLNYLKNIVGIQEGFYEKNGFLTWKKDKELKEGEMKYLITDMGQWYFINIKINGHFIMIRDSLKLLPFSLKQIGKDFQTKHQKLTMQYKGMRTSGGIITPEEMEYIKNDVLVLKEALEIMFAEGHDKLTIASCCMDEYKKLIKTSDRTPYEFKELYPNLLEFKLNKDKYNAENADEYIRKSYKGGWCYVKEEISGKLLKDGLVVDVNSLYPSVMISDSGNRYPFGMPFFWVGDIPRNVQEHSNSEYEDYLYYFVTIRCRFEIKEGFLPFLQLKGNKLYRSNECLKSHRVYSVKHNCYLDDITDEWGNQLNYKPTFTLTCTDFKLFMEHYNVYDLEVLHGCYFYTTSKIFDDYLYKYREIKLRSKGAKRTIAKLFSNNLYGRFAINPKSEIKVCDIDSEGIHYKQYETDERKPLFIPIASAITSYARDFTIRAAQKNVEHFAYADTDSLHLYNMTDETPKGISLHDKDYLCWKIENRWKEARFIRQKTYIEYTHILDEEPLEEPIYIIKCAGLPLKCKILFNVSLTGVIPSDEYIESLSTEEYQFLFNENGNLIKRTIFDFDIGLKIPGKLKPTQIKGGTLLQETEFTMR